MKSKIYYFLLLVTVFFCNIALAQTSITASSYFCDFEDVNENDNWVLNNGTKAAQCKNKWYIGNPGASMGERGLFISCNQGQTADYVNSAVSIVSFRELTLEAGDYELSFDWRAGGTNYSDGLYVCWIPKHVGITPNSVATNFLQNWINVYGLSFGRDSVCLNQRYWNSAFDATISSDGTPYYLVFVWSNGSLTPYPPGVCVDNILITKRGLCSRPTNFKINPKGSDILLSWEGDAESYEVKVYNYVKNQWYEYNDIKAKYFELQGMEEGMMSFYVRSKCDSINSAWVSQDKFFYFPAIRCIDYLNLNSNNCYTGTYMSPLAKNEVVDHGSRSDLSRHTIHWDKTERDPLTNGMLKTVPDGELASVRLGNKRAGKQGEGIIYNFIVDTLSSAVLLLNYAVVLQDPADHKPEEMPSFILSIMNGNKPLDDYGCGEANFVGGVNTNAAEGWMPIEGGWWKDWTTVAIDLRKYHGKSLKICFGVGDCGRGAHFGYAYFTLGCTDGKIHGLTCGAGGTGRTEFLAPEGFKYKWYDPKNPEDIISTDRKFTIEPEDTATYYVDVIQPTNSNCYYTEHVSGVGRLPRAKANYELDIKNCENYVRFDNKSFIQLVNQINNDSSATSKKCDEFFWDFGDGDTSIVENPVHRYPDEGGTYTVRLKASIEGGCDNWTSFDITLPKIGTTCDTTQKTICANEFYVFEGDTLYDTGIYVDSLQSIYGCDSIIVLDLYVAEKFDTIMYDTICAGEEYYFRGRLLSAAGVYSDTTQSPYGCDSIFTIHFQVIEPMNISIADGDIAVCEDEDHIDVNFDFASGARKPVEYSIYFDNVALSQGFVDQERMNFEENGNEFSILLPENCTPDTYTATFLFYDTTFVCSDVSIPVEFDVYASILQPKFGNLITVLDKGYDFVEDAYEWYVNGVRDSSTVGSFYYLPDGETFDEGDCYYMIATRRGDGKKIRTCEICPGVYTSVDDVYDSNGMLQVTIFEKEQAIETDIEKGYANIYSLAGELLSTYEFGVDRIKAPAKSGLYILQILLEDGNYTHKIWVK